MTTYSCVLNIYEYAVEGNVQVAFKIHALMYSSISHDCQLGTTEFISTWLF